MLPEKLHRAMLPLVHASKQKIPLNNQNNQYRQFSRIFTPSVITPLSRYRLLTSPYIASRGLDKSLFFNHSSYKSSSELKIYPNKSSINHQDSHLKNFSFSHVKTMNAFKKGFNKVVKPFNSLVNHNKSILYPSPLISGLGPGGRYRKVRTTWQKGEENYNNFNNYNNYNYDNSDSNDLQLMFNSTKQKLKHPVISATLISGLAIFLILSYCMYWDAISLKAVSEQANNIYVNFFRSNFMNDNYSYQIYESNTVNTNPFSKLRPIFILNGLVYLAFAFRPVFMSKHFIHYPYSGKLYTLFTSVFAHVSFTHIFFNMLTLNYMLKTTLVHMTVPHVYAMYLTSGVFSSWLSHVSMIGRYKYFGILPVPTLGASGAIYSLIVMYGLSFPYQLTTFPFMEDIFTCYAINMIKAMVCGEIIGSFIPSSPLNHVAHLGGAITGYFTHSSKQWWKDSVKDLRKELEM